MFKKITIGVVAVCVFVWLFFILAPLIPMPIGIQKKAMSVLYSDESVVNDIADRIAHILPRHREYGFVSQEEFVIWITSGSWMSADGGTRQIYVEPEFSSDTINSLKITTVYKRDGSRTTYCRRINDSKAEKI